MYRSFFTYIEILQNYNSCSDNIKYYYLTARREMFAFFWFYDKKPYNQFNHFEMCVTGGVECFDGYCVWQYEYDQLSDTRINYKFLPYLNMGARFCNVLKYAVSVLTRTEAFIEFMNHEIMFYIKYDWWRDGGLCYHFHFFHVSLYTALNIICNCKVFVQPSYVTVLASPLCSKTKIHCGWDKLTFFQTSRQDQSSATS